MPKEEDEPSIKTSIENGMLKVILNRPSKKNAFTSQMYKDLTKILNHSANNDDVTHLAMTGSGDFYSSGNDFVSYMAMDHFDVHSEFGILEEFVRALILYPKLLIAIVNGPAIGIAATTLLLFDIVYASENAYLMTPFCKIGLSPEGCSSYTFPKMMGSSKAVELLVFGEKLYASEALRIGLVSKVYKSGSINEIWTYLEKISSLSKDSLATTKKLLGRWNKNLLLKVNKQELAELKKLYNNPTSMGLKRNIYMASKM